MANSDEAFASFATLAEDVADGKVQVDVGDLKRLVTAADVYIHEIRELQHTAIDLIKVESFGGLKAARALGQKFKDLTDGTPSAGLSWVQLCEKRITIMQGIQAQFQKAIDNYPGTDDSAAQGISRAIHGVGH